MFLQPSSFATCIELRSYEWSVWMSTGPDGPSLVQFFILSCWLLIISFCQHYLDMFRRRSNSQVPWSCNLTAEQSCWSDGGSRLCWCQRSNGLEKLKEIRQPGFAVQRERNRFYAAHWTCCCPFPSAAPLLTAMRESPIIVLVALYFKVFGN